MSKLFPSKIYLGDRVFYFSKDFSLDIQLTHSACIVIIVEDVK